MKNLIICLIAGICFICINNVQIVNASKISSDQSRSDNLDEFSQSEKEYILGLIISYADMMVEHGRDRYGEQHSPLFAQSLTRDSIPTLIFDWNKDGIIDVEAGEYPEYSWDPDKPRVYPPDENGYFNVFHRYVNIPLGYEYSNHSGNWVEKMTDWNGDEYDFDHGRGAHKQTVTGMDLLKNDGLLYVLYKLSEVTGNQKYADAADSALDYWFYETQNRDTGLYPWGEHLAWNFVYDAPVYSTGPNKGFHRYYASEWLGDLDYWDILIHLPAREGETYTPLEKLALGLWECHFWDKEKVLYDRHANYYTCEPPYGEHGAYPRLYEHFMDVWSMAYIYSGNEAFQDTITNIMYRAIDGQRRAIEQNISENDVFYNHPPFSYNNPEYNRSQHRRQALGFALAANRVKAYDNQLAFELRKYADEQLDEYISQGGGDPHQLTGSWDHLQIYKVTGRTEFKDMAQRGADNRASSTRWRQNARRNHFDIKWLMRAYSEWNVESYRTQARWYVDQMIERYMDEKSPLPKFIEADSIRNWDGTAFDTWYSASHGSDNVMETILMYLYPDDPLPDPENSLHLVRLEIPGNGSENRDYERELLSWNKTEGADTYHLQVSREPNFVLEHAMAVNQTGIEHFFYEVESLQPDTRYYWRVKAEDEYGSGGWSEVWKFSTAEEVGTNVDSHELPAQVQLEQNYPNPFNPVTHIQYALPESAHVRLTVINVLGEHVSTLVNTFKEPGFYGINFDASHLSSGVYIFRLQAGNKEITRQMMLLK